MILLVDNYDSFSYNLYQLIGEINPDIKVVRNDEITIDEILKLAPTHIILSPGPKSPNEAGICLDVVKNITTIPIFGVCLGHQTICQAFGMTVTYAKKLMHGKKSLVTVKNTDIFANLPEKIEVARYHSLAAVKETITDQLEILAWSDDDEIMAVKHKTLNIYGVQFHPESILTQYGKEMLVNFLEVTK